MCGVSFPLQEYFAQGVCLLDDLYIPFIHAYTYVWSVCLQANSCIILPVSHLDRSKATMFALDVKAMVHFCFDPWPDVSNVSGVGEI